MNVSLRYPRSFTLLLLLSFLLVVLPLIGGLLSTASILDRLSGEARRSVETTVTVTRTARQLVDGVDALQRAAVQAHVFADPKLLQQLHDAHRQLQNSIAVLLSESLTPDENQKLEKFADAEESLYGQLAAQQSANKDGLKKLAPRFDELHTMAVALVGMANQMIDRETATMQSTAESVRRTLILQGIAIVPLSLFLAIIFSWLINRPVRQISRAIRRLGEHDMAPAQTISGPSDLVQLGQQIDWLRQRLLELEEQKVLFLRHVSHELKTPLAALREGVELLVDRVGGELTPQQTEITEIMRGNVRDLQQMIDDLIDYSRLHQPQAVTPGKVVSLEELIDRVLEKQKMIIRSKGLTLDVQAHGLQLADDEKGLEGIFANLLSNAVRFSPKNGRIEVEAETTGRQAKIRVCDQGPGVANEDRASIFKPFFRGKVQPDSLLRGSGLGLAIVQEYLERRGGQVSLIDRPAWGACFEIVLAAAYEVST